MECPVNFCTSVGLFLLLSLLVSSFEDRASSSRGKIERRLISLIFVGRNRIIMIRLELPLTKVRGDPRLCRGGSRTLRIPGVCSLSNCQCCGSKDSSTRFLLLFLLLLRTVANRPL